MSYLLVNADARRIPLEDQSVHCVATSSPYFGLRDYGVEGQIGLEATPDEYVTAMVGVFREVRRVLRADGTCWLNLGDTYLNGKGEAHGTDPKQPHSRRFGPRSVDKPIVGLKNKDLIGIPWRVALALQADGWWLRSEIIWHKSNPMPESVADRPTKSHEQIFLLTKSERYFYDADAVREPAKQSTIERDRYSRITTGKDGPYAVVHDHETPSNPGGRNLRSVWTIATTPYKGAHFATFPVELASRCIKAGCPMGGTVFDPFNGAATTGVAALSLGRHYVGTELNPKYLKLSKRRLDRPHAPVMSSATTEPELPMFTQMEAT